MPTAWMTEPHDSRGTQVSPPPFQYSETEWGRAYGYDFIPRSARFTNGTCAKEGKHPHQDGSCLRRVR